MKGLQWSFSNNKTANTPQILSFKSGQQDGGGSRKPYRPAPRFVHQGNVSPGGKQQAGNNNHCPVPTSYTRKQHYDTSSYSSIMSQPHDARNHSNTLSQMNRSHYSLSAAGHDDLDSNVLKTQSVVAPVSSNRPANCSIVGTTDPRNASKPSCGPAQLTIFYDGLVCVYDDVSPEKAQAIMLLAGNGNPTHLKAAAGGGAPPNVQSLLSRPPSNDVKSTANQSSSHLSPASVLPSPPTKDLCSGSTSSTGAAAVKLVKPAVITSVSSAANHLDLCNKVASHLRPFERNQGRFFTTLKAPLPEVGSSTGAAASGNLKNKPGVPRVVGSPGAELGIPQARKASLARFLEKRKERVVRASPYNASKSASECNTSTGYASSLSTNGTGTLPAIN